MIFAHNFRVCESKASPLPSLYTLLCDFAFLFYLLCAVICRRSSKTDSGNCFAGARVTWSAADSRTTGSRCTCAPMLCIRAASPRTVALTKPSKRGSSDQLTSTALQLVTRHCQDSGLGQGRAGLRLLYRPSHWIIFCRPVAAMKTKYDTINCTHYTNIQFAVRNILVLHISKKTGF